MTAGLPTEDFDRIIREYAGFIPGLVASIAVSVITSRRLARVLAVGRSIAAATVMSLGIILSATITPSREALEQSAVGSRTCDLSRIAPALDNLGSLNDTSLNVLLFIPLGVALAVLPGSRPKAVLIISAVALPFAIEATQLVVPALDRKCQSGDVVDNLTGLALGLAAGIAAGRLFDVRDSQGPG